jgi:hypothetical protein
MANGFRGKSEVNLRFFESQVIHRNTSVKIRRKLWRMLEAPTIPFRQCDARIEIEVHGLLRKRGIEPAASIHLRSFHAAVLETD